jgi:hypothetical protein
LSWRYAPSVATPPDRDEKADGFVTVVPFAVKAFPS